VAVFDSHKAMSLQSVPMFFRTDTHWTPAGAEVVAQGVAKRVISKARYSSTYSERYGGHQRFTTERVATRTLQGDLINFLPLSPWFDELLPEADQLTIYQTYLDSTDDLFAEPKTAPQVALVGTSYSANNDWNFAGALQQAMSSSVVNFAASADGPFVPMADFIEARLPQLEKLKLVVWEIPERYLLIDYAQKMNYSKRPLAPRDVVEEGYVGLAKVPGESPAIAQQTY
jgi:alginate O-acetyltransferase complex protein AlgJ